MANQVDNLKVSGHFSCTQATMPNNCIDNRHVSGATPIEAEKLEHEFALQEQLFAPGSSVTNVTKLLYIARAAGEVRSIEALVTTIATGADRTVTVDLQKATAGGAFATILSATIVLDDDSVVRVAEAGTLAAGAAFIAGDVLQLVVTVAGAAGAQAEGLLVAVGIREHAA
jgi:hypothetical protein